MPRDELPILRVEGKDDRYVIEHLLSRHGIDWQIVEIKYSNDGDEDSGGKNLLLDGIPASQSGLCRMPMVSPLTGGERFETGLGTLG